MSDPRVSMPQESVVKVLDEAIARAEKAERELGTELLANAGLVHQLEEAEKGLATLKATPIYTRFYAAEATIARIEALKAVYRRGGHPADSEYPPILKPGLRWAADGIGVALKGGDNGN